MFNCIDKGLWWDKAWTLVQGCDAVSAGCDHCWAAKQAHMRQNHPHAKVRAQYRGHTNADGTWNGAITMHWGRLEIPTKVRKPIVWSVWNDLFHPRVTNHFIDQAFRIMRRCPQHLFLILTKRPATMALYASNHSWPDNAWPGTTVENEAAVGRLYSLRQVPAPIRFVSCEPLLEPVHKPLLEHLAPPGEQDGIHWVIAGAESGPRRRYAPPEWFHSLRSACLLNDVPFFLKQMDSSMFKLVNAPAVSGRQWLEMPALRFQEGEVR